MSLEELKFVLNQMYEFDISRKTRKREVVYAKKVFIQLAKRYGWQWKDIVPILGISHDNCIFHFNSFGCIRPMDLHHFNSCIDYFNIPLKKIPSVDSIDGNPRLEKVIDKVNSLSRKDLKYFDENVLNSFLKKLSFEKLVMESKSN